MSKSTDHDFNEIVYDSVLPEIARAFCSLKKEVSGNKLVNELSPEENEIIKIKSKMLNKVITDFIQKHFSKFLDQFKSQRFGIFLNSVPQLRIPNAVEILVTLICDTAVDNLYNLAVRFYGVCLNIFGFQELC